MSRLGYFAYHTLQLQQLRANALSTTQCSFTLLSVKHFTSDEQFLDEYDSARYGDLSGTCFVDDYGTYVDVCPFDHEYSFVYLLPWGGDDERHKYVYFPRTPPVRPVCPSPR